MSIKDPQLHRIRCSAKSLCQMRNSCAHKELQSHGVEDGLELGIGKHHSLWNGIILKIDAWVVVLDLGDYGLCRWREWIALQVQSLELLEQR